MPQMFTGRWKLSVMAKNAGFSHRVRVTGATVGNGVYPSAPGTAALIDGTGWSVFLEWNDGEGSGWQESAVLRAEGFPTPITRTVELRADDNVPSQRDNDFDDLVVRAEFHEAPFDVVRRPAAINRSSLTLYPDGIFDAGQGLCFMAVRVRATFVRAWSAAAGVRIGIGVQSRSQLASSGIVPIDAWSAAEQEAFGQRVEPDGFVQTGSMAPGDERILYFKLDVSGASPSKPEIGFVARAAVPNVAYEAPGRVVRRPIFVTRSTYDPVTRELHARLPEGDLFMRLNRVMGDSDALQQTLTAALAGGCRRAAALRQDSALHARAHARGCRMCRRFRGHLLRLPGSTRGLSTSWSVSSRIGSHERGRSRSPRKVMNRRQHQAAGVEAHLRNSSKRCRSPMMRSERSNDSGRPKTVRRTRQAARHRNRPTQTSRRGMVQPNALLPGLAIRVEAGRATRRMEARANGRKSRHPSA